ncbi:MAG: beta-ketoacyl-[acyl-carrier-protein] synthase family protein [Burkholderiales bacterium]|nr:beta-ketoacyl-[acyl-carrier-protein] synthase family protein [Burkholderiales bacterium]
MTEVCITGYGVVSPLGDAIDRFDTALFEGRSAIRGELLEVAGQDPCWLPLARCEFDAGRVRAPSKLPLDRGSAMALAAAESAAAAATLNADSVDPLRLAVYWGSGMGGASTFDANCRALYADHRRMRPTSVVTGMPNAPLAELALRFGARAAALGYACACASAAVAIGEGLRAVREGRVDVAIVGGSEALISPGVMLAWQAMRVLAPVAAGGAGADAACRPFGADRNGFALGEGAAALVLESAAHARSRGATWRSRLAGYATNCDARHITQPDPEGQQRAMADALRDAGLSAADIGHVNAHGTATQAGDAAEAESLRRLFTGNAAPAVSGTKAIVGHLLGAGGALELVATLRALERRLAPPTGAVDRVDPAFEIDLVRGGARELPALRHAMSNSFAFGGTNAVLIASAAD